MPAYKTTVLYTVTVINRRGWTVKDVHRDVEAHCKREAMGRVAQKYKEPWDLKFKAELQVNRPQGGY